MSLPAITRTSILDLDFAQEVTKRDRMKLHRHLDDNDVSDWKGTDFDLNCTHVVRDRSSGPDPDLPKVVTSIPRNLTFYDNPDKQVLLSTDLSYDWCGLSSQLLYGLVG